MSKYKVGNDEAGKKEVIWQNAYVDKPTLAEVNQAARDNFPDVPQEKIGVIAGIMMLIFNATQRKCISTATAVT